jgi:hypothetical protein
MFYFRNGGKVDDQQVVLIMFFVGCLNKEHDLLGNCSFSTLG